MRFFFSKIPTSIFILVFYVFVKEISYILGIYSILLIIAWTDSDNAFDFASASSKDVPFTPR